MICLSQKPGAFGSVFQMRVCSPADSAGQSEFASSFMAPIKNTTQITKPPSMHAVCRVSVKTIVLTPPWKV